MNDVIQTEGWQQCPNFWDCDTVLLLTNVLGHFYNSPGDQKAPG